MQICLLYAETAAEIARRDAPAEAPAYWGAWTAYMGAMREAGVLLGGNALRQHETGARLRLDGGRRSVQDGPFPDAKEQLGGYVVIEVPDMETALEWAARAPCAGAGHVEVRPVLPMQPS
jgi:hypothetical protein